jgi:hypothetical protein
MNVSSCREGGFEERRFARGTSSIRSRSMHVVDRNEDSGSDEPAGAGGGAVDSEGTVDILQSGLEFRASRSIYYRSDFDVTDMAP